MTGRLAPVCALAALVLGCATIPSAAPGADADALQRRPTLTDLGAPVGGLPVIADLAVFDDRLWLVESRVPLAVNGAALWTYEPAAGFVRVLDDPFSQGFLRGDVIDGKLYVADGDPRGFVGGIVHIFETATAPPLITPVDEGIHNFQVVRFGPDLYVTGGLADGSWGLNQYDPAARRWIVVRRGSHLRLKYVAVFDEALYGIVAARNGAELVRIDRSLDAVDLSVVDGQGTGLTLEVHRDRLYMTGISNSGPYAFSIAADGAPQRALQGLSGVVFDFAEHNGVLYAVGADAMKSYLYGSVDGLTFTRLLEWDDLRFGFAPGSEGPNADGRPSLASFRGNLYVASSNNGRLYRLDP